MVLRENHGSGDGGQNRAWLDGVSFTPGAGVPEPFALTRPRFRRRDGLFSTVLHGPPGVYVVEETSDAGEWVPRLTVTNLTGEVEIRTSRATDREPRLLRVHRP